MEDKDKTIDDVLNDVIDGKDPEPKEDPKPEGGADDPKADDPKPTDDDPKNDPDPEDTDENPDDEGDEDPKPDDKEKKPKKKEDSSVIRNLRQQQRESSKQVKEYEAMIERIAKQQGISKDELVEKLQQEADEKEAKEKNISPEIQKQLREQQEALDNLKQERQREVFNTKFDKLADEFDHLKDNEKARDFVKTAIDMGFDLGNPNTDFRAAYIAQNYESLVQKAREEERQKTLQRIEEQNKKSPGLNKKRNQSDGIKKGSIDDALADIFGS